MTYIIIDNFDLETPEIVTDKGKVRIFNTEMEAVANLMGYGIHAIVVPLSKNLIVWEETIPEEQKWPDL